VATVGIAVNITSPARALTQKSSITEKRRRMSFSVSVTDDFETLERD